MENYSITPHQTPEKASGGERLRRNILLIKGRGSPQSAERKYLPTPSVVYTEYIRSIYLWYYHAESADLREA